MTEIKPYDCFIEIGPGGGALTEYLLSRVNRLIAIEIDSILCAHLTSKFSHWGERFCLYHTDALTVDFSKLDYPIQGAVRLIGNLPYNVATPLLFHLLKYSHRIHDFHVMVQKEVADRLVAVPGHKAYSRLSVMMQYYAHVQRLFNVPSGAFLPPPKVESSVIKIVPWQRRPFQVNNETLFAKIVKAAFSQRRKQVINSLRSLGIRAEELTQCQIDVHARAEELTVNHYVHLSNIFEQQTLKKGIE